MSNDIIGQENIKKLFLNSLKNDTLGHCYALEGESGMGKSLMTDYIAQMVVCENHCACGSCKSCVMAQAGSHPDIEHIVPEDGKKNIGVEAVRSMIADIYVRPYMSKRKVIIINNFELAMPQAQNAILKVLEEPPEYVLFLLTVSSEKDMLDTVKSRSVMLKMQPYTKAEIGRALSEKTSLSKDEIAFSCAYAAGNIGKALKIASNEEFTDIRKKSFSAVMALIDEHRILPLINLTKKENSKNISSILECLLSFLRDIMLIRIGMEDSVINRDFAEKLSQAAQKTEPEKLVRAMRDLLETENYLRRNINDNLAVSGVLLGSLEEL